MKPLVRARAPLRLGLAGGGTDLSPYCDQYGGQVLNATISLFTYTTISLAPEGKLVLRATDLDQEVVLDAAPNIPLSGNLPLHRGVYNRIVSEFNGGQPLSITLSTHSDVPAGSGLGSSSTVVVSMVQAFCEYLLLPLGEYEVAHLAYEIERLDLGLQGGRQDQYAAAFGGLNFMEFQGTDRVLINPLRVKESILAEFEASLVLYFTGVSRDSAAIIDEQIGSMKTGVVSSFEAMHELKADAVLMKEQLLRGNIRKMAEVLGHSWHAKKKLSDLIATSSIDVVYNLAMNSGAYAGKITGAGGGGFMMFLVDPEMRPVLSRALAATPGRIQTAHLSTQGSMAWRCG